MSNLIQVQTQVKSILQGLLESSNINDILTTSFGDNYNNLIATEILNQWQLNNFSNLPVVIILSAENMQDALGGYSIEKNTVYLSNSLIDSGNISQITSVLLEEYGHYFSSKINDLDVVGDEGQIFSFLVQNNTISDDLLSNWRSPNANDSGFVEVNGELISVENATLILTVNTTSDQNDGSPNNGLSLRDAILIANRDANNEYIIQLEAGQTYGLTLNGINENGSLTGDLDITKKMTIETIGTTPATIEAATLTQRDRVFHLLGGGRLTIDNIIVKGGSINGDGGGFLIADNASLIALDSLITGNSANNGGGIISSQTNVNNIFINTSITSNTANQNGGGMLGGNNSFTDSSILGNIATADAGGLAVGNNTITNSRIIGNIAGINGGGVFRGNNTIINSTISDNRATDFGGGIARGTNTIIGSTISNNTALSGGGIASDNNTIVNSTISGNTVLLDGGGILGIGNTIINSTITNNLADSDNNGEGNGGGLFALETNTIRNTIIANNFDTPRNLGIQEIHPDISGTVEGNNFNLISNITGATGTVGTGSDKISTNVLLAPLANYGGVTQTHALYSGSSAINAGNNNAIPLDILDLNNNGIFDERIPFDQRGQGFPRVLDGRVDIGAFEGSITNPLNTLIYRFQNTSIPGTYLFVGAEERQSVLQNFPNFVEEGEAFKVGIEPADGLIALNRFQNSAIPGTYLFATPGESESIRANFPTFIEEGIAFYVGAPGSNIGQDFFRFQNSQLPGTYLFAGVGESQTIRANFPSFVEEGLAFGAGNV